MIEHGMCETFTNSFDEAAELMKHSFQYFRHQVYCPELREFGWIQGILYGKADYAPSKSNDCSLCFVVYYPDLPSGRKDYQYPLNAFEVGTLEIWDKQKIKEVKDEWKRIKKHKS